MEPTKIVNGLAMYSIGEGEPVFVVPYPHAGTFVSIADDSITQSVLASGRSVITFDPPGAYNSTRLATVDMAEMMDCMNETLERFGISKPIDILGHSMGSFCALAYATQWSKNIKRLVLVGCTSGWKQQLKYGIHTSWKWWRDKEFWLSRFWGTKVYLGFNNLALYNKLNNMVFDASFVNKRHVRYFSVSRGDHKRPVPKRGEWLRNVQHYDYHQKMENISCPVLICAGRFDVQTPLIMNRQINDSITNSEMIIFEHSGHFPFIEENELFLETLANYLR